eukprot:scaffold1516_cov80-Skeletonema_dohrnii-CCMP3373.AAC.6
MELIFVDTCRPVPDHLVDLFSNSCYSLLDNHYKSSRRIYTKSVSSSTDPETRLEHLLPRDKYTQTYTSFQLWTDAETRLELRLGHIMLHHSNTDRISRSSIGWTWRSREARSVHQGGEHDDT